LLSPLSAAAQEESPTMVRAMYYSCDASKESRADELVDQTIGPVYDRLLAAGDISGWGWLAHSVGGKWRRVAYWAAPSQDALLDATEKLIAELPEAELAEFNAICRTHDDYMWRSVAGSSGSDIPEGRAAVGVSSYYRCDMNREERADELVTEVFAPVLDRHVAAGDINSWSWLAHAWGGKARRLMVFDGTDQKALLNGYAATFDDLAGEGGAAAMQEFFDICPVHEDYIWNIVRSKP
jgi:hypothetical protein